MSITTLIPPAAPMPQPALVEAEARQALDLAQQGFLVGEIAELLDVSPGTVAEALEETVPGGAAAIASALRRRSRA